MKTFTICLLVFAFLWVPINSRPATTRACGGAQVDVRIVDDEAESVLAILETKNANRPVTDADWKRLLATEGYLRLKKRELSMSRSFDDAEFKAFVLSDELAKGAALLRKTVDAWKQADMTAAAARALAYLPAGASIRANIYPVIKPGKNSFVFEVKADPAIFLYVDPDETKDQFENTVAHELHHIGYGGSFRDVPEGRLEGDEISKVAYSFFGIQGHWYTVGWKMAVTIEKTYGRARLIECFCDPRGLLPTYNQAARDHNRTVGDDLALWSDAVVAASARPK